jgi:hypothetical protein
MRFRVSSQTEIEDSGLRMLEVENQPLSVGRKRCLGKFLD